MTLLHRLASIVRWIARRDKSEQDLHDELQTFVDMAAAAEVRDGATPAEAHRLAVLNWEDWNRPRNTCEAAAMAPGSMWFGGRPLRIAAAPRPSDVLGYCHRHTRARHWRDRRRCSASSTRC